ncbi:MAG: selenide, water dikinase SelD [Bryobacterales bacterium]|nr:selenide, water dikinase SelD [Bryobacterales bacterium]
MAESNLSARVKGGGCASKLSPKILDQVLSRIPRQTNPAVIVGFDTADDAGVYQLSADCALVQTIDFFTPVVDDPFTFGAVAAANALSDVWAMGGRPLTALSVLAWPGSGDLEVLEEILRGGAEKMQEASCVILGGHSVSDEELKFGYAVTGTVDPRRVLTNAGAQPGDALVLTKRIGTGVVSSALKKRIAAKRDVDAAIQSMLTLNRGACEALLPLGPHGCTDVTGFGLIGHAREMALASGVTLEIDTAAVQFLPGALEYSRQQAYSSGLRNNREFAFCVVEARVELPPEIEALLYDPQTSGGLLAALPEAAAGQFLGAYPAAYRVGRVLERGAKPLLLI